ncbi:predicted protein [Sclerotinia sclerotiorum 1980 UF-70]|uniref:Uncharacterized protein n=1 Tax=Sclerotinia sclerotiorum (strain ATCC 18683 / 1980 / Ss-1) TaxID=665079 RepID=A7F204_SCLS1|nr:predicted protein [Sclerotinia sclerotiorum 1980 UF-70]EDN95746.1 predicted protein [Sclerotinia sclerotiorum 1980 UF-70]
MASAYLYHGTSTDMAKNLLNLDPLAFLSYQSQSSMTRPGYDFKVRNGRRASQNHDASLACEIGSLLNFSVKRKAVA